MIKTEKEYEKALARLEQLFQLKVPDENEELNELSDLIEEYENKHYPIDLPDPIAAINFRVEQMGYTEDELERYLGKDYRDILNGKKELTEEIKEVLINEWGISKEVLN